MKKLYIENLHEGMRIEDIFLVASKSVSSTRTGSQFIKMRIADKTGSVDGIKWNASDSEVSRLAENDYILLNGTVSTYQGGLQVTIDSFSRKPEGVDPSDFIASSARSGEEMLAEINEILTQVRDVHLKKLLDSFFCDAEFSAKIKESPAAQSVHHAFIGGLAEHTLGVVKLCAKIANSYPQVDKDILLTVAALHDIGKVEEFSWNGAIRYSEAGSLVGHIVIGAEMIRQAASKIDGFDPLLTLALQHCILAHHGQHEYGSPVLPKSIEALILHHADDLDAKIALFDRAITESDKTDEENLFTQKVPLLGRNLFKGVRNRQPILQEESAEAEEIGFNDSLFAVD